MTESQIIRGFVCQATSQFGIYFVGNEEIVDLLGTIGIKPSVINGRVQGQKFAESSHGVDLSILRRAVSRSFQGILSLTES